MKVKSLMACVAALLVMAVGSLASTNFGCYGQDFISVERNTAIRDLPGFSGVVGGAVIPEHRFPVLDLKHESGKRSVQAEVAW